MADAQHGNPTMPVPAEHPAPTRQLSEHVERFLRRHDLPWGRGGVLVAFSGGPDSTALLWSLAQVARSHDLALFAAHLDHGLDRASSARAARARELAAELDVTLIEERLTEAVSASGREGIEAAARRLRYEFLRRAKGECGADWIAVGHHRDDQLETVVLRLLFGSGLTGLGAMSPVTGDVIRPFLDLGRDDLSRAVARLGLTPTRDPGNDDPRRPRNQVRRWLLPALRRQPGFSETVVLETAEAARRASLRLRQELGRRLQLRPLEGGPGAELDLGLFRELAPPLRPFALDALRRAAGAEYAAPAAARRDLDRQTENGARVGCDCGAGWFWESSGARLRLTRRREPEELDFSYTLRVPGELSIPEVGLDFRLTESRPAPWMFRGSKSRAAMLLPLKTGQKVLIRNRRPGDRLRPLGCHHQRKLKDLLIDRRVERGRRDALPLLVVEGKIAWVPGITIDDTFRLEADQRPADDRRVWVAELRPQPAVAH